MWTIKPKTTGIYDLCLDLNANILVDGAAIARTIRTFSKTIHMTVRPAQRVTDFVKAHWQ